MFSVSGLAVPPGPDGQPVLPGEVWDALHPAAQAAIAALLAANARLEARVRALETTGGQYSGNSSRPPSSDPPQAPRRPAAPPSGRARGGQPGHAAHQRAVAPPERVDHVVDHRPETCAQCAAPCRRTRQASASSRTR
jgi:transposase